MAREGGDGMDGWMNEAGKRLCKTSATHLRVEVLPVRIRNMEYEAAEALLESFASGLRGCFSTPQYVPFVWSSACLVSLSLSLATSLRPSLAILGFVSLGAEGKGRGGWEVLS